MWKRRNSMMALALVALMAAGCQERITDGDQGSWSPRISDDGRYITFESSSSNLAAGDDNGVTDVFVWERATDTTSRITDGDAEAIRPSISSDGRFVAYESAASNLVAGDGDDQYDIFVWDRSTGTTTRITDGNFGSHFADISGDGRYVTFSSGASNLVPGDTNHMEDVFVWDRATGTTTSVTHGNFHSSSPTISADGRSIAFLSQASNLVPGPDDPPIVTGLYLWDATSGATTRITSKGAPPSWSRPALSADGRYVAYGGTDPDAVPVPEDPDGTDGVYVWDRTTATSTLVTGGQLQSGGPAISADGRHVTYYTFGRDGEDGPGPGPFEVYRWDRDTGRTTRITKGNEGSETPDISADGRSIAYVSFATDTVPGDTDTNAMPDVFLWYPAT